MVLKGKRKNGARKATAKKEKEPEQKARKEYSKEQAKTNEPFWNYIKEQQRIMLLFVQMLILPKPTNTHQNLF